MTDGGTGSCDSLQLLVSRMTGIICLWIWKFLYLTISTLASTNIHKLAPNMVRLYKKTWYQSRMCIAYFGDNVLEFYTVIPLMKFLVRTISQQLLNKCHSNFPDFNVCFGFCDKNVFLGFKTHWILWVFRMSIVGQDATESQPSTGETWKDINSNSCHHDMTEILLKAE